MASQFVGALKAKNPDTGTYQAFAVESVRVEATGNRLLLMKDPCLFLKEKDKAVFNEGATQNPGSDFTVVVLTVFSAAKFRVSWQKTDAQLKG